MHGSSICAAGTAGDHQPVRRRDRRNLTACPVEPRSRKRSSTVFARSTSTPTSAWPMTGAVRKFLFENPDKFDAREWLKPARAAAQAGVQAALPGIWLRRPGPARSRAMSLQTIACTVRLRRSSPKWSTEPDAGTAARRRTRRCQPARAARRPEPSSARDLQARRLARDPRPLRQCAERRCRTTLRSVPAPTARAFLLGQPLYRVACRARAAANSSTWSASSPAAFDRGPGRRAAGRLRSA